LIRRQGFTGSPTVDLRAMAGLNEDGSEVVLSVDGSVDPGSILPR
jgi:hypothetical protein